MDDPQPTPTEPSLETAGSQVHDLGYVQCAGCYNGQSAPSSSRLLVGGRPTEQVQRPGGGQGIVGARQREA